MISVAIIPVFGRLPLLKHTIERLLNKNGLAHVIALGETDQEKEVIELAGGIFVKHQNRPLGKKWNAGFQKARELKADVCVFVGSSDWLSDNWLPTILPYMNDFDMIGKPDFTMMDLKNNGKDIRMCHWDGYAGDRANEPIGIGRVLSSRILDSIDWKPFEDHKDNSMDFAMFKKCLDAGGKVAMIQDDSLIALSISCDAWPNMHQFEQHWNNRVPSKSHRINNMEPYFKMFPEYKEIFR